MARGRRTRPSYPVSQRRRTDWSAFFDEDFALGTTAVQLGSTSFTTVLGTETLARVHGIMRVGLSSATSVGDGFRGAIGFGKVQDEAFQAGVGSVPSPLTEVAWDGWFYHQFFDVRAQSAIEAEILSSNFAFEEHVIDVKSMRKVDDQENFIVVIEATETGAAVGQLVVRTRALSLLP